MEFWQKVIGALLVSAVVAIFGITAKTMASVYEIRTRMVVIERDYATVKADYATMKMDCDKRDDRALAVEGAMTTIAVDLAFIRGKMENR